MTQLDVGRLRTLIAVATFGGVRAAAMALGIPQPTVTSHVRGLERELGFRLIQRRGRNIEFTVRGEELLREAHHLVAEHDAAIARLQLPQEGRIHIASNEYATEVMLSEVAHSIRDAFPSRELELHFHRTARLRELVHTGRADVALGVGDLGRNTLSVASLPLIWCSRTALINLEVSVATFTPPCGIRERILTSLGRSKADRECSDLTSLLTYIRTFPAVTALPATTPHIRDFAHPETLPPLPDLPLTMALSPRVSHLTAELLERLRA